VRAVAILAAVLAAGACRRHADPAAAGDTAVQLGAENVAVVTRGVVESGPLISGTLSPIRTAQIRAQVSGPVLETYAEQGAHVGAGELLARVDATAIEDTYASAKSAVAAATVAADVARRQGQRYDTLLAAGAISSSTQESVAEQRAAAEASLANAQSALASARKQLDFTSVRSPFVGVVSARNVSRGDVVQVGAPLYTVVDPSALQLEAAVPAEQIGQVHRGAPVSFSLTGYGTRTFTGTVTRLNPVADPTTRQVPVYAELANPGNALVGGLFATGRIVTERDSGLVVPTSAIDVRNLRPAAERLRGGKVERIDVTLGLRDDRADRVQVRSGVALGDTLLLGTAQGLTPGTAVRVVTAGDSALRAAAQP
jgi:RND family efflux transporter MFP subunit